MRADEEARSRIPGNLEARQNGDFTFCGIDGRDGRVARDIATADRSLQFKVAHRSLRLLPQVPMKSPPGPPATRGSTAAAHLRLIGWCKDCRHQAEPDRRRWRNGMARRYRSRPGRQGLCAAGAGAGGSAAGAVAIGAKASSACASALVFKFSSMSFPFSISRLGGPFSSPRLLSVSSPARSGMGDALSPFCSADWFNQGGADEAALIRTGGYASHVSGLCG
jgi:hypothetical protein